MLKRKKLLAALLAGTMMLSLVGCGKKADTSGDTTDTTDLHLFQMYQGGGCF